MNYTPTIGDLLVRPKTLGFVDHVGVVSGANAVFHNTPDKGEHISTIDEFAAGKTVTLVATGAEPSSVRQRIRKILKRPGKYDVIQRNCEHSAYEVLLGVARSPQLIAVLVAVGFLALVVALMRR